MKRDTVCSNCESDDRWILHHVHHRNTYRRLCTTCVLKLNITSFCPICFSLHNKSPQVLSLVCLKCNSSSHTGCVGPNTPKSPYLCPTCSNPHLKLFDFRKSSTSGDAAMSQVIDLKSSKVFLAAAMIAENSLKEAAEQAKVEAERKAKESVAARKRAKERCALVHTRDQERITPNNSAAAVNVDHISNGVQQLSAQGVINGVRGASHHQVNNNKDD